MPAAVRDRAKDEALQALHRLLNHRRSRLGIDAGQRIEPEQFFPVNPRELIELSGWTLEQVAMVGHTQSGEPLLAKCVRTEKRILLLSTLPEEQKRFSLAHELGHALLHSQIPDCNAGSLPRVQSMRSASNRREGIEFSAIEREAEVFARELLMPERAVRRQFRLLFGVEQLRAGSALAAKYIPAARGGRSQDLRALASQIAGWSNSEQLSIASFFGVSVRSMSSRLIGLSLVY